MTLKNLVAHTLKNQIVHTCRHGGNSVRSQRLLRQIASSWQTERATACITARVVHCLAGVFLASLKAVTRNVWVELRTISMVTYRLASNDLTSEAAGSGANSTMTLPGCIPETFPQRGCLPDASPPVRGRTVAQVRAPFHKGRDRARPHGNIIAGIWASTSLSRAAG